MKDVVLLSFSGGKLFFAPGAFARVIFGVYFFEHRTIDVCVDLGCSNISMAQELLDYAEVGAALEHVGCK